MPCGHHPTRVVAIFQSLQSSYMYPTGQFICLIRPRGSDIHLKFKPSHTANNSSQFGQQEVVPQRSHQSVFSCMIFPPTGQIWSQAMNKRSLRSAPEFWLAFEEGRPGAMVGTAVSESERFNLIGMWVEPAARGSHPYKGCS